MHLNKCITKINFTCFTVLLKKWLLEDLKLYMWHAGFLLDSTALKYDQEI